MIESLFDKSLPCSDADFVDLRAHPRKYKQERHFIDLLWKQYAPYADSNFPIEIGSSFHQRYWEMYLTCTLIEQGFAVASSNIGPDVHITKNGETCWIEAIAAKAGSGPDAVSPMSRDGVAMRVPTDQIILRHSAAIKEKFTKYQHYLSKGIVGPGDSYVIAINGFGIPYWQLPPNMPWIVSAVLPFGDQYVTINRKTMKAVGEGFEHRPSIVKQSGSGVPTTVFQDRQFEGISAVLYSTASIWSYPELALGHLTYMVFNPLATNPIPRGVINVETEYWVDNDVLCKSKSR